MAQRSLRSKALIWSKAQPSSIALCWKRAGIFFLKILLRDSNNKQTAKFECEEEEKRRCEEGRVRRRRSRGGERRGRKIGHLAAGYEATFLRSQFISRRIRRAWVVWLDHSWNQCWKGGQEADSWKKGVKPATGPYYKHYRMNVSNLVFVQWNLPGLNTLMFSSKCSK